MPILHLHSMLELLPFLLLMLFFLVVGFFLIYLQRPEPDPKKV